MILFQGNSYPKRSILTEQGKIFVLLIAEVNISLHFCWSSGIAGVEPV